MEMTTTFEILPAIDLRGGRVVRLAQGDFDAGDASTSDDPAAVAAAFADGGARWLHVVDLDGARTGDPAHRRVDRARSSQAVGERASVEVAGGLRDRGAPSRPRSSAARRGPSSGRPRSAIPAFAGRLVDAPRDRADRRRDRRARRSRRRPRLDRRRPRRRCRRRDPATGRRRRRDLRGDRDRPRRPPRRPGPRALRAPRRPRPRRDHRLGRDRVARRHPAPSARSAAPGRSSAERSVRGASVPGATRSSRLAHRAARPAGQSISARRARRRLRVSLRWASRSPSRRCAPARPRSGRASP